MRPEFVPLMAIGLGGLLIASAYKNEILSPSVVGVAVAIGVMLLT